MGRGADLPELTIKEAEAYVSNWNLNKKAGSCMPDIVAKALKVLEAAVDDELYGKKKRKSHLIDTPMTITSKLIAEALPGFTGSQSLATIEECTDHLDKLARISNIVPKSDRNEFNKIKSSIYNRRVYLRARASETPDKDLTQMKKAVDKLPALDEVVKGSPFDEEKTMGKTVELGPLTEQEADEFRKAWNDAPTLNMEAPTFEDYQKRYPAENSTMPQPVKHTIIDPINEAEVDYNLIADPKQAYTPPAPQLVQIKRFSGAVVTFNIPTIICKAEAEHEKDVNVAIVEDLLHQVRVFAINQLYPLPS